MPPAPASAHPTPPAWARPTRVSHPQHPTCDLEHLLRHLANDLGARVVVLVDPAAQAETGRGHVLSLVATCGKLNRWEATLQRYRAAQPNQRMPSAKS